jgi:hypothetical protein
MRDNARMALPNCRRLAHAGIAVSGGVRRAARFAGAVLLLLALSSATRAVAADQVVGDTYDDAVRSIPFDRMTDEAQGRLWRIVSQPSLYRRLPITRMQADPDLYLFLIRHPEVIVNMWDLMGVTKVRIRRNGEYTFDTSDGAGTNSQVELVYGDRETHVLLAEGTYDGPLFMRMIHGRCLLVLRTGYTRPLHGSTEVTHQLDMFLQLDNVGAELIAKTLHPLVGKTADHNFVEASRFLGQVSQAAESRPEGVQKLAGRLTKIEPAVRDRFSIIASEVYQRTSTGSAQARRAN